MMRQRGDHMVTTEPFSYAFYHGPERVYDHLEERHPNSTFAAALQTIMEENKKKSVFVKEIANHIGPLIEDKKVVLSFRYSLLIGHPAWVVPSFHRVWPEFFKEDMDSFQALADIFTMMKDAGEDPVVIEAHDLRNHPEKVVMAWCEQMGIPFISKAIKWEKGMPEDWKPWAQWFTSTSESTGFITAPKKEYPPLTEKLARIADANRPLYLGLEAHKLQV